MKFKIIEYNILDGFHTRDNPARFEPERLKAARELIEAEKPDILVLPEACDDAITKHGIKVDYAKEFDLPYHFHGHRPNGSHHGISILSLWPFIKKENYSVKDMKFIRTVLKIDNKILTIDALHPHPDLNDTQTAQSFKVVIRDSAPNTILVGDLNSWSRTDKPFDRLKLIEKFRKFEGLKDKDIRFVGKLIDDRLTFEAMDVIENSDYVDTYHKIQKKGKGFTVPTNLTDIDKSGASRIDYIFCSKEFKVIDAGIIKTELAEKGSDHYPIYAVLELK